MCQSVWVTNENKDIGNCGEFADWLCCDAKALVPVSFEGEPVEADAEPPADWRAYCLCQVDIPATLDNFRIWHRRDVDGDSMRYLALGNAL
jgi:hypothetical protein